jgi:putative phosphoribosyl transferase
MAERSEPVKIDVGDARLEGEIWHAESPVGVVAFAHGSGSSRMSPRNRFVARELVAGGISTLLLDLLTRDEEEEERWTRHLRFDIELLARRLVGTSEWLSHQSSVGGLPLGLFGSSTGAAAALVAAGRTPERVKAVVSRGGRPDLAGEWLSRVRAPVLLIVGSEDHPVIELNKFAYEKLGLEKELRIVKGASHLFEEPGTLDQVVGLALAWFEGHLREEPRAMPQPER